MPSYHLSVKSINRKDGRSAVAASAYRSGTKLTNNKDGVTHDFSRRHGVINQFLIVPDDAPEWAYDRESLWNHVEEKEKRKDAKTAREFEIALPKEIGTEAREALVREFCESIKQRFEVAIDVAIHRPDGSMNYHAHVLCSTRTIGPDGFGEKTRSLDVASTSGPIIEEIRADFARMTNRALEARKVAERVDHRSYARQGIDLVPGRHRGPVRTAIARRLAGIERRSREARHIAARLLRARPIRIKAKPGPSLGWGRRIRASINLPDDVLARALSSVSVGASSSPASAPAGGVRGGAPEVRGNVMTSIQRYLPKKQTKPRPIIPILIPTLIPTIPMISPKPLPPPEPEPDPTPWD